MISDAELFAAARDLLIKRTGRWSAKEVLAIARACGWDGDPSVVPEPTRQPRQRGLGLRFEEQARARAILDLFVPIVAPQIAGRMTATTWRQRNTRVAVDLARVGAADEALMAAHAAASERLGGTCYSLKIVQEQLLRDGAEADADPFGPSNVPFVRNAEEAQALVDRWTAQR